MEIINSLIYSVFSKCYFVFSNLMTIIVDPLWYFIILFCTLLFFFFIYSIVEIHFDIIRKKIKAVTEACIIKIIEILGIQELIEVIINYLV